MAYDTSFSAADFAYPNPPANCPANLAKPNSRYKLRAWLAMVGLAGFVVIYLALTVWFLWSAYYMFTSPATEDFFQFVKGAGSLLIGIFFIKNLFFRKQSGESKDYEIKRDQEPLLFEFLDRLAAETKAPRPHKVFLSPEVNACVFYDLSILNFLFPSRKNLMIGLGLVNSLTLSEFKAVLAHEFGHFAQSSMAVGRWVYIAQQVAVQLIYHRDWFDSLLTFISRFDLRVAWIGWILKILVWAIRSVLDTLLSFVMLAHRALSREMEYQADLVAVTNTGSDSLIHALHRLSPADDAWSETQSFVNDEIKRGHVPDDVFAIQSRILEHKRRILDDEEYGLPPSLPETSVDEHRIFTSDLAQPPQMWSTHPANHLREENAKRVYVAGEMDDRSAWCVFSDPEQLRRDFTAHLLQGIEKEKRDTQSTIEQVDKDYDKYYMNPDYRGVYLDRSIVSKAASIDELYDDSCPDRSELYPEWLPDHLEKHRNLEKEHGMLEALRSGHFKSTDGVIRFRGDTIQRGDLGEAIETVDGDLKASNEVLLQHDRKCRTYYRELARKEARGWPGYLEGLLNLVHYADHSLRNLLDAYRLYQNTLSVVLADGNVSSSEATRLVADCNAMQRTLKMLHSHADKVFLDDKSASHLDKRVWKDNFEALRLPPANRENLGEWVDAASGWVGEMITCLSELRTAALETLLEAEQMLEQGDVEAAPCPPRLPQGYETLIEGNERNLQTKLNFWDSFQTASGIFPATLRFLASALIVFGAIWLTYSEGSFKTLLKTIGI